MADVFDYKNTGVSKCPNCGADMIFDPSVGALRCGYCNATRPIEKRVCFKRDFDKERRDGEVKADNDVYKCPNCGGDIVLTSFDTAVNCPYCGATNVVKAEDMKGLKPDGILPFALSQEDASKAGKKWIKKKIFAPFGLKKNFAVDKFKGIYIPSYAFTSDTHSSYEGRLGERRTRTVGSGKDRHTETYIHWYNVSGNKDMSFEDMPVEASTQIEQKELNKILPFDTQNLEAYNRDYIAGFAAERYDTSLEDGFSIAQGQMNDEIKDSIKREYNADVVDYLNVHTNFCNNKFHYMLLPLWVCSYKYRKKLYGFIINGRTGKSTGKSPVSPWRVAFVILIALGIVALVAWLYLSGFFTE